MATIPKSFYKLPKSEQERFAIRKMQEAYEAAESWKKLSIEARGKQIPEPKEADRPDEAVLKSE